MSVAVAGGVAGGVYDRLPSAGDVGEAAGRGAVAVAGGVAGGVYDRLPSAGDVGEAAGRGAVAVAGGVAGVVRGGIRAATSPRIGEQTGGVARGLVEDVSSGEEESFI